MGRTLPWLTILLLFEGTARAEPAQPDISAVIYTIGRDMAKMQAQIQELRDLVVRLSAEVDSEKRACSEPKAEKPAVVRPPAATAAPPPAPAPPASPVLGRGTVAGKVLFDRIESRTAYVYLADVKEAPVKGKTAEIRQRHSKFHPDHLVVQSGTRIFFPNDDKIHHNVFSATPSNVFDLAWARSDDPAPSQLFVAPGVVEVNCNIHLSMQARVLVVPNRHWTRVAKDGSFTLPGAPLGKHELAAWAPGAELNRAAIVVEADAVRPVTIQLEPRGAR